METFEGLDFVTMTEADVRPLTDIMTRAFDDDSRRFFGKPAGGPDGYNDGSFLTKWGLNSGAKSYRIDRNGAPIGAMILFVHPQKPFGHLGCLFVDPDYIGQGIGTVAWRFAERAYPHVRTWTTETPAVSYRNHRFYINKCGFRVVEVEGGMDRFDAQFKMIKELPDA